MFSGGRSNKSQTSSPHNQQNPHSPTKHRPSSASATNRQSSHDNKLYRNKTDQNQNRPHTGVSNNKRSEGEGQKSNRGGRCPGGQGGGGGRGGRRHSHKSEGDRETQQSQNSEGSSAAKNQIVQSNPGTN